MSHKTLLIDGMTCQHCVRAVTNALKGVRGVKSVNVSLAEKKAVVEVDDAEYSEQDARQAVREEGYTAR